MFNLSNIILLFFQIYELKMRGYTFKVLDNAFLSHRGFQTSTNYTDYRRAQIKVRILTLSLTT